MVTPFLLCWLAAACLAVGWEALDFADLGEDDQPERTPQ